MHDLQRLDLVAQRLVELGLTLRLVQPLLDGLQVGECELDLDHPQVLDRIVGTVHIGVHERPQHEHDRIDLTDVGEELVAEALTLARSSTSPPMSTTCTEAWTMFLN